MLLRTNKNDVENNLITKSLKREIMRIVRNDTTIDY